MRTLGTLSIVVLVLLILAACAPAAPTAVPAKPAAAATVAPTTLAAGPSQPAAPASSSTPAQPAAKIKRGGTLVTAASSHSASMDPVHDGTAIHLKKLGHFEALVRYFVTDISAGKLEIQPELAESWQQVDPTTIVFKLRKGVKFHDGSDFNAEVAKWSLERMGNRPKSVSKMLAANFDTLEVVDPYTLKIKYKAPSGLQLINLTLETSGTGSIGPAILSKAYMDKVGEEAFGVKSSATGPFKLDEWKRDSEYVLSKFDGYWKKGADGQPLPYLDSYRSRLISDTAVQAMELKAGTLHLTGTFTSAELQLIKNNSDLDIVDVHWAPNRTYFGFNDQKEPFGKNLKLRQAAQYATDRVNFAKVIGGDTGRPNYHWGWTPAWPGYEESLPYYDFNLDKAQALMKEAGFPNGAQIALIHYVPTNDRKMAEVIQSMWAKAGIKVDLQPLELSAARAKTKAGEFEMHVWGMNPSPDPAHFNRMFTCEGSANWNNYCNKETDKCMVEGERETDVNKRTETYKRCQRLLYEDAQLGTLDLRGFTIVNRKEVKGLKIGMYTEEVAEIWLDKP